MKVYRLIVIVEEIEMSILHRIAGWIVEVIHALIGLIHIPHHPCRVIVLQPALRHSIRADR